MPGCTRSVPARRPASRSTPPTPRRTRCAIAIGLGLALPPALAQTAAPAAPVAAASAPAEATTLPPVSVTASGGRGFVAKEAAVGALGELSLIETPFSINVITNELLVNQQAAYLGDFLKNDPSATIGNVPVGFATLRGFATGTAGYLYDGLPGNNGLSDGRGQLEAIDRIDILKGPNAFLYGLGASTSLGGTLNYVPKRPTDAPLRVVTLGYTTRTLFSLLADVGDRFGEARQFGYRVNLGLRDGEQAAADADWKHGAISVALDWRATPDVLLTAIVETADNQFPRLQPFYVLAPDIAVPAAPKASHNTAQPWDDFHTRYSNAYLRADWAFAPQWSATAQVLYNRGERLQTKEARFGAISDANGDFSQFASEGDSSSSATSGQLLVHGKFATGPVDHQVTIGVSGGDEDSTFGSAFLGVFPSNLYNPVAAPEPPGATPEPGPKQKNRASSLLLSDILSVGPQWSLLLGARSARLTLDTVSAETGLTTASNSISKTSPTAALLFKPTPDSLVYLNYAEGLEPGGQAPAGSVNENQVLPPLVTGQVELGAKLALKGLLLTAALFDLKKPFEYVDPASGTYVQNGEQRHKGLELLASGQIGADWSIVAGAMWLDPTTTRTGDAATEGKRPVGVSRFNANAYAEYRVAGVPGLFLNAGVYHNGSQFVNVTNTQQIPSWTRFDVGGRYETQIAATPVAFLLNVENVADKSYWASAQQGLLTLAEPLTVKAAARVAF